MCLEFFEKFRFESFQMSAECCYICNECPSSFSNLPALEAHLHVHAANKTSKMEQQLSIEEQDSEMNHHSPSSSDVSEGQSHGESHEVDDGTDVDMEDSMMDLKPGYNCRFCQASFEDQSQLNVHYTHTHRDKPQYKCDVCSTVFAVKRELSTHMRIHSGEQPHKCTQCGKEFGTRQLLKKHWMWHTGERTHVCKHCNKAFFQKGHLTQHLMIHSGGRPHQCQLCQKTFIFKFDLNRHMKIHAERGFSCSQCGRSFQRQLSLDEHSLKCKGKAASQSRTPPARIENNNNHQPGAPMLPLLAPSMLNFTNEQMAKMAQNMLAQQQQRAISAFLASQQPVAPAPTPFFCVLCSQHFSSQQMFAIHMYATHMNHQQNVKEESETPSLFPPMNPIKTDDEEQINVHSETATNSSCASSPQKASPQLATSPTAFALPESPKKAAEPKEVDCSDCESQKRKVEQLENALREKTDELRNYKEMMKAVVSTAGQLLGQCSPENVFIAHTKNIFSQLQSTLLTSE